VGTALAGLIVWYLQSFLATLGLGHTPTLLAQFAAAFLVPLLYLPVPMVFAREDMRRLWDIVKRLFLSRLPSRLTRAFRAKTA
jgi:hypothetical protein